MAPDESSTTPSSVPQPTQPDQPTQPAPDPVSPQPKSIRKYLISGAVAVVVLGGIAAGAYYGLHVLQPKAKPAAVKDITHFTYGMLSGPLDSFYPKLQGNDDEITKNEQIFEGLVTYRDKKIVPNLATSWSNPNTSTWLFTLKSNIHFHNGHVLTPSDVVKSVEIIKGTDTGDLYANTIKTVEPVGTNQVKITTDGPDATLLNKLVFLYIIDGQAAKPDDPANGTGPFTLKPGTTPTAGAIDLVAFNGYHGGHVGIQELSFKVFDQGDDAMAAALKKGDINLAAFSDTTAADAIKSQYAPLYLNDPTVFGLYFNYAKAGPQTNQKVRQAIAETLDAPSFMKGIGVTGTPASQIVVQDIPGYDPTIKPVTKNVAHAKTLLTEAGYPNGLTLVLSYKPNVGLLKKFVTQAQTQLKDIGITLQLDSRNADDHMVGDKTQAFFLGCSSDIVDLSDVYQNCLGLAGYTNKTADADLATAAQTLDPTKRLTWLQKASAEVMQDYAEVTLYSGTAPYLASSKNLILPEDIPATAYPGVYFWRAHQ